jgi:NAD(P)-dependent dehydrogenase (short-subunit alcohol dehydrogenase family)
VRGPVARSDGRLARAASAAAGRAAYGRRTMQPVAEPTVLITGSSSGIDRATARHFHARGWNVVATMRDPGRETELDPLDRVLVTRLDVQDEASIHAAVAAGLARFGRLDALVNNAGYGAYGPLEATPMDALRRQFEVNVLGLLATT